MDIISSEATAPQHLSESLQNTEYNGGKHVD